ncbi:hypothetical protein DMH25_36535 [Streptomyces sp. WAC 01325]|nr:hypothetical protein DMH25_36535 [Streptomyces sp. WAC 01325]
MYNLTIPSTLKAYLDNVVLMGRTAGGGRLPGRRVVVGRRRGMGEVASRPTGRYACVEPRCGVAGLHVCVRPSEPTGAFGGSARRRYAASFWASCLALVAASSRARSREASKRGTSSAIAGLAGAIVSSGTMKSRSAPRKSARIADR